MYDALAADAVALAMWSVVVFAVFVWGVLLLYVALRGLERSVHRRRRVRSRTSTSHRTAQTRRRSNRDENPAGDD